MALAPLLPGDPRQIGTYRLVGRLGAGGMGVAYLAHAEDGSLVAVKQVRTELAADDGFRARFRRETSILTQVRGPFTAAVLTAQVDQPPPYLVLEYVNGPSLAEQVGRSGPLPADTLRGFAAGLAAAVLTIHREGIVHRDLKPANVLLAEDGPKVIDFGLAHFAEATRLTETGLVIGSPGFMAPEQLTGTAGTPADIYSWALTVAFAGTGRPPFGIGPLEAIHHRVLNAEPDLDGIPEDLTAVLRSATVKDAASRPTAQTLVSTLTGEPATRSEDAARALVARTWQQTRVEKRYRGRRLPMLIAAVLAAVLVVAATVYLTTRPVDDLSPQATTTSTTTTSTSTSTSTSTTVASTTTRAATRVFTYQPWAPNGPSANVQGAVLEGTCIASSSTVLRREAFRCMAGDIIHDPCFVSPFESGKVACPVLAPDRVVVINLADPPPLDFAAAPTEPRAWLIELADGQRCNAASGATVVVDGLRLNFHCPNGFVYGEPDTSSPLWTIRYQANGSSTMEAVSVIVAYQ